MMKPFLNKSLLAVLSVVPINFAYADYNGGQISNAEVTHTGDITIDYDTDQGNRISGAVELTGTENNGKTTVLEGNIRIKVGEAYRDDATNMNRNSGVWVGYPEEMAEQESVFEFDTISNATVLLKTVNEDDQIVIDVYGRGGRGVVIESYQPDSVPSVVTLDASASGKDIIINSHNEGIGSGIAVNGRGRVNVIGNVVVGVAQGTAIDAGLSSDEGVVPTGEDNIYVTGTTTVNVKGEGSRGIRARSGGQIALKEKVSVNMGEGAVNTYGMLASQGGRITLDKGLSVVSDSSSSGMRAMTANTSGMITVSGDTDINVMGVDNYGIHSDTEVQLVFNGRVNVDAGRYGVAAYGGSLVAFHDTVSLASYGKRSGTSGADAAIVANGAGTQVQLSGGSLRNHTSNLSSSWSTILAYAGGVVSDLGGVAHEYEVTGAMRASNDGATIDLKMNGKSSFRGYTLLEGAGTKTINLSLSDDSLWTVTGNSALTNLTLGQGSALELAFSWSSLTDIITAAGAIMLEAGSVIYLTGDLSGLQGESFDFFSGTVDNQGVKFVGFDGNDWVEYEYTQTGLNTFEFSQNAPVVIEEPGFLAAIPEPATATLGLLGLASLMFRRRRG